MSFLFSRAKEQPDTWADRRWDLVDGTALAAPSFRHGWLRGLALAATAAAALASTAAARAELPPYSLALGTGLETLGQAGGAHNERGVRVGPRSILGIVLRPAWRFTAQSQARLLVRERGGAWRPRAVSFTRSPSGTFLLRGSVSELLGDVYGMAELRLEIGARAERSSWRAWLPWPEWRGQVLYGALEIGRDSQDP